jgi:hypothetical protein
MDLSTNNSSDLLYASLSGEFSLDEAKRTFLQILEGVERFEVKKVLVDGRAITGHPTTMERFYYGEFVAHAVIDLCMKRNRTVPKFSYVLLKPVLDGQRLGETVALNRGMNVKTFDDLDDALKWLRT